MIRRLACLTLVAALAGCNAVPQEADNPQIGVGADTRVGVAPLPADASVELPGTHPPQEIVTSGLEGSLAPDNATPEERIPEIVERGKIIVGVDQALNLISFRDPITGELTGFDIDLAHEVARDIFGNPDAVEFRFVESADRVDAITSGKVDMVIRSMTITKDRAEKIAFSTPYLDVSTRMLVRTGSPIRTPEDIGTDAVCVTDRSTGLQKVRQLAPEATIIKTRSWSDCLVTLQQGQTTVVMTDDTMLSGIAAQDAFTDIVGPRLAQESYGIGIARANEGLVRQVNSTLERIFNDGTWDAMYTTWFSRWLPPASPPPLHYREEEQ